MEDEDEWFFESIKMYKNLFMYDLQQPATAFNWTSNEDLCVATSNGKKNEIIELTLPNKLSKEENGGNLTKDRDFKYKGGGSCACTAQQLCKIGSSRKIVCSTENSSNLVLYELSGEKSDLIKQCGVIENLDDKRKTSQLALSADALKIVFGSHTSNLCLCDTENKKAIFSFRDCSENECISGITFIDNHVCVCCEESGSLIMGDIRDHNSLSRKQNVEYTVDVYWTLCQSCDQSGSVDHISTLSSNGTIFIHDVRMLEKECMSIQTTLSCDKRRPQHMRLSQSPLSSGILGVSGFDACLQIFDTRNHGSSQNHIEPIFVHKGHAVESTSSTVDIVSHIWHPETKDLIISAGNDGSLHAWQPVMIDT